MLMYQQLNQVYRLHQYPLKQNGPQGSRRHCYQRHRHLCHHLVNHRSCRHQNQQVHWMHHQGRSHRILQDRQPIRQGLYQIAEHHKYRRCHHRLE